MSALCAAPLQAQGLRPTQRECHAERFDAGVRRLWEQAHTVIRSADIARGEGLEIIAIRRLERTFDRDEVQRDEAIADGRDLGARLFRGGPDLASLTSTEFTNDHCFAVVEGRDATAGMIGLAFEPRDTRMGTGIAGVMWLHRTAPKC